jgi:hypothetical protein
MTTRTTTAMPGKIPGSATRTIVTKTVTVTPARPAAHQESMAAPAGPARTTHAEHRAAPAPKPAHHVEHKATSKPAQMAAHESEYTSKTTTDHDAIRQWAEKRGGHPTSVTGTEHGKESAGVLRLDFGVKDEKLHAVDWDSFFEKFEEAKLAFLYQDKTANGKMSRFHKFIHRH